MAEVSDVWTHQKRQNPFTSLGNSLQSCKGPWRNPRRNATDSATRNQTRCALKSALRIVKLCCVTCKPVDLKVSIDQMIVVVFIFPFSVLETGF